MFSSERHCILDLPAQPLVGATTHQPFELLDGFSHVNGREARPISIGTVNAAIIAGNPPEQRASRLREFWERVSSRLIAWPLSNDDNSRSETSAALSAAPQRLLLRWSLTQGSGCTIGPACCLNIVI
jgi:hypothetical protein